MLSAGRHPNYCYLFNPHDNPGQGRGIEAASLSDQENVHAQVALLAFKFRGGEDAMGWDGRLELHEEDGVPCPSKGVLLLRGS